MSMFEDLCICASFMTCTPASYQIGETFRMPVLSYEIDETLRVRGAEAMLERLNRKLPLMIKEKHLQISFQILNPPSKDPVVTEEEPGDVLDDIFSSDLSKTWPSIHNLLTAGQTVPKTQEIVLTGTRRMIDAFTDCMEQMVFEKNIIVSIVLVTNRVKTVPAPSPAPHTMKSKKDDTSSEDHPDILDDIFEGTDNFSSNFPTLHNMIVTS